jgi:hypothetical protein
MQGSLLRKTRCYSNPSGDPFIYVVRRIKAKPPVTRKPVKDDKPLKAVTTGSDATLDNAHVAEDYLARTTTMYRIIQLVGLVLYPEPAE